MMVSFIPKFCELNLEDAKAQAITSEKFETDLDSARGEYIFLLDRSGSMSGNSIIQARNAIILFLKSLPVDSYFNVVSFGSSYEKLTAASSKNSTESIQHAVKVLETIDANLGGT